MFTDYCRLYFSKTVNKMMYQPFFDMNILMTAEALNQVKAIAFI